MSDDEVERCPALCSTKAPGQYHECQLPAGHDDRHVCWCGCPFDRRGVWSPSGRRLEVDLCR